MPRPEQVRALRCVIFGKGDTLLVARTGFGKSRYRFPHLFYLDRQHYYSLEQLGDEQLDDQLSRRNVLTISCSCLPQKAVRWFSWCTEVDMCIVVRGTLFFESSLAHTLILYLV
jgi:hypothetical protein